VHFRPALGANPFIHDFAGFQYFMQLWTDRSEIFRVLQNTLAMSFLSLAVSPLTVALAILMMELRGRFLKRFVQTVTTFPHFISWVIVFGIAFTFFSNRGVFAEFLLLLGFEQQTTSILANRDAAWYFQTALGMWKSMGWGAIIYCAAIAGIDESLYEAAQIDGASRFRCVLHITIPGIAPTYFVLLLLAVSNILSNNFEQIFVFMNNIVAPRLQNIDYYAYRMGLQQAQWSFSVAIGIVKSIVGLILLFSINGIAKKIRGKSII
jgi:ABC-type polysaccharide transport system permease subunit